MPTIYDVAPGKWITAEQFKPNEEKTFTIKAWLVTEFKDRNSGEVNKSVSFAFEETDSTFGIINAANKKSLNQIFGTGYDLNDLVGRKITLFTILIKQDDAGNPVYGIRLKKPSEILQKAAR